MMRHPSLSTRRWHSVGRFTWRVNGSAEDAMAEADLRLELIDLSNRLNDLAVQALLSEAVGYSTPAKLAAITARYATEPARTLYGAVRDGELLGALGIERVNGRDLTIYNVAVAPTVRRTGIGRAMIVAIRGHADRVSAETDRDAVGFYARCGFTVRSLGELYPGTERFACVWMRAATPTSAAATPD
jgi:ribosomal protein S18 acetylase RimI-like enzyme